MKKTRLLLILSGALVGPILVLRSQPIDAERRQFEFVKTQAERGDAQAQLTLASFYAAGTGVNRDPARAAKWYRKAAEQGLAKAQYELAYQFANGIGVKMDHVESVKWLRRAADRGFADAQFELGQAYASGDGIPENPVEAANWYRKAADQNLPAAEFALGNCYFEGTGVTKDVPEGLTWTRKAAEEGFPDAENSYGMCYAKGKGVPQDYLQAYKWFNLAAAQNGEHNTDAKINLSMAERAMTPEQIAQGQKLAREFKPRLVPVGPASATASKNNASAAAPTGNDPGAAKVGFLNVKADDDTCDLFVDGAFVGNAPARIKLEPGSHVIEVKKTGFKDFRREIRITEGSDLTLRAVLEKQ